MQKKLKITAKAQVLQHN